MLSAWKIKSSSFASHQYLVKATGVELLDLFHFPFLRIGFKVLDHDFRQSLSSVIRILAIMRILTANLPKKNDDWGKFNHEPEL